MGDRRADPRPAAEVLRGPGEVAEDDAPPALARTYDRLREALGVPFVPTIFRKLAHHDEGFLRAATDAFADAVAGPACVRFAVAARERAAGTAARLPDAPLPAAGCHADAAALLERYNRANPLNLLFAVAVAGPRATPAEHVMRPPLPTREESLLADVRACHGGLTVPGVWRELAAWPEVARAAWERIRAAAGDAEFLAARSDLLCMARGALGEVPAQPRPRPDADLAVRTTLSWFLAAIPTVIIEIEIVRRGLGTGRSGNVAQTLGST